MHVAAHKENESLPQGLGTLKHTSWMAPYSQKTGFTRGGVRNMGSWRAWHRERQHCPAGLLVQQPHGFVFTWDG